ncbi:MAG: SulP family inorganic anion transporter, partial [Spirochaetota bacterium]|nr:SulP family inorganic anion transporter [Spirochaetota bacterium]
MKPTKLHLIFPFLNWLPELKTSWRQDLTAGLIGAVIVMPQGVAFAMIAGMPPQYGLYAAMIPAILAGLFGSSRHLITGPTTAISLVVFATLTGLGLEAGTGQYVNMALLLAFMTGIFQLSMGLARLGTLVNFISHSVVIGFTAGAAILIATSQLKHLFGLQYKNASHFYDNILLLINNFSGLNWQSLVVGLVTLVVMISFRLMLPKLPGVGMLVGMVTGAILTVSMGWVADGVKVVGSLPSALPDLVAPDASYEGVKKLVSGALVIAMLGLMEAVSIARSVALNSGQRIDGNQEFIGQGISNMVGAFFSSYACSGSFTRTGLNYQAGAKTAFSAVFSAIWLIAILFFVRDLAVYLPIASMAAVILLVAYNLIDFHHIKSIAKVDLSEAAVMAVTFLATLLFEIEFAIYIGAFLSIGMYLKRSAVTRVLVRVPEPPKRQFETNPDLPECPQFGIVRLEGDLYFAAVTYVIRKISDQYQAKPGQTKLLIVMSAVNHIDISGIESIHYILEKRRDNGGDVFFYGLNPHVLKLFKKSGLLEKVGEENLFSDKEQAIEQIVFGLDTGICAKCKLRVFWECDIIRKKLNIPTL